MDCGKWVSRLFCASLVVECFEYFLLQNYSFELWLITADRGPIPLTWWVHMELPGSVWGLNRPGIKQEFAYYHYKHFARVSRVHEASMHILLPILRSNTAAKISTIMCHLWAFTVKSIRNSTKQHLLVCLINDPYSHLASLYSQLKCARSRGGYAVMWDLETRNTIKIS